jgi:hypothetical protein
VFENRVPRRCFEPRWGEVTEEWKKLHNAQLIDLYSSPNIARVIKSEKMSWAGHIACRGKVQVYTVFLMEKRGEKDQLEDPCIDGIIILQCIFKKWDMGL